jgi:hypothetical protein
VKQPLLINPIQFDSSAMQLAWQRERTTPLFVCTSPDAMHKCRVCVAPNAHIRPHALLVKWNDSMLRKCDVERRRGYLRSFRSDPNQEVLPIMHRSLIRLIICTMCAESQAEASA